MTNRSSIPTVLLVFTFGYAALQIISVIYAFALADTDTNTGKELLNQALSTYNLTLFIINMSLLFSCGLAVFLKKNVAVILFSILLIAKLIEQIYWFDMTHPGQSIITLITVIIFYGGMTYGSFILKKNKYYNA